MGIPLPGRTEVQSMLHVSEHINKITTCVMMFKVFLQKTKSDRDEGRSNDSLKESVIANT